MIYSTLLCLIECFLADAKEVVTGIAESDHVTVRQAHDIHHLNVNPSMTHKDACAPAACHQVVCSEQLSGRGQQRRRIEDRSGRWMARQRCTQSMGVSTDGVHSPLSEGICERVRVNGAIDVSSAYKVHRGVRKYVQDVVLVVDT